MTNTINAIIIDDEEGFILALKTLLQSHFPQVNIIGKATNVKDGISLLNLTKPDIVFLDISLPDGNAFDILEACNNRSFEIIFTTASTEHAIRAFEFAALHYIIKPINLEKLQIALERFNFSKKNFSGRKN